MFPSIFVFISLCIHLLFSDFFETGIAKCSGVIDPNHYHCGILGLRIFCIQSDAEVP
jgi:hypothetical protein